MSRWTLALLAAVLGTTLALPAQAQWKWRDKNGQTQYSDLPPPGGVPEQDILSRPNSGKRRNVVNTVAPAASAAASGAAAASGVVAAASSPLVLKTVEPELEAKRKKAEADQAAKAKVEEAKVAASRAENCTRARTQMRTLDSGIRVVRSNDKGEREVLDDKQRADEVKRTRDIIAADCRQ
jgi:hypothetical protein